MTGRGESDNLHLSGVKNFWVTCYHDMVLVTSIPMIEKLCSAILIS